MKQAEKKTVMAVSKSQPSSSSSMNDPAPQSLFVVLYHRLVHPCIRILQLEAPAANKRNTKVDRNEYVACFNLEKLRGNSFSFMSCPPLNSTSPVMYIMPGLGLSKKRLKGREEEPVCQHLHGFEFNISTGECRQSKPVTVSKLFGQAVNCKGHIYVLENLDHHYDKEPHPSFERYDPDKDVWEALIPFPVDEHCDYNGGFAAFAVWDDTILYNLDERELWAYHVKNKKWYEVQARDEGNEVLHVNRCYNISGKAIVINNFIYALSSSSSVEILELSIQCIKKDDDDLVYICSLSSVMRVLDLAPPGYMNGLTYRWSRKLVDLGNHNFCLVQSSFSFGELRFQPIYVTNLKLKELEPGIKWMTVTNEHTYVVELDQHSQFGLELCFSLPKDNTMCKTKHGLIYDFEFDLKPEGLKPVQASTRGDDDKKGHCIYVRNLPPDGTEEQLVKELKKFGPIKGDGICVYKNETVQGIN